MPNSDEKSSALGGNLDIDELGQDALKELVNISVGRSADALSRMVDTEVLLTIPSVELMSISRAQVDLRTRAGDDLAVVRQDFHGSLNGNSMLLFSEKNSLGLVRLVVQEDLPQETLGELEQDVLRELGNVFLNSFIGSLGNVLDLRIETGLPYYERYQGGTERAAFKNIGENKLALVMQVDFNLRERDLNGYLGLLVSVKSATTLVGLVRRYFEV